MGIPVMILGESGSGKSTSLRNFDPNEVGVFNVAGKPLPFKHGSQFKLIKTSDYAQITSILCKNTKKCYVIDDSQYLMAFEFFSHANETGYGKFTEMALRFYNLIQTVINNTSADTVVYFLHHTEVINDKQKAKTCGKMLDEKLTVEGLFSIVLYCTADSTGKHIFITQNNGNTTAKSPIDMFPLEMDNDLKAVDTAIREYYFGGNQNEEN